MKVVKFFRFLFLFLVELTKASFSIAYLIVAVRKREYYTGFATYPIDGLTHLETMVLAHMITLTPGTIVCKIDEKAKELIIHVLSSQDPKKSIENIDKRLKKSLLEVTR